MIKITANQVSTSGTSNGQILTSNGTVAYWTTGGTGYTGSAGAGYTGSVGTGYAGSVGSIGYTGSGSAGGGGFSNGQSISVANLAITGSLTVANSVGTSGQALVSTGTGVQWGALSPGYNYSSQFNGSSSYFTFPNSSAFAFGTGAFTVEFWIYAPLNNNTFILGGRSAIGGSFYVTTGGYNGATTVGCFRYQGSSEITSGSTVITDSAWHHCAVVRNASNAVTIYIDGISRGTGTDTNNYTTTSGTWYVGTNDLSAGTSVFNGFISNLRIIKGTAVYTSTFTPSTTPLSAITNTSLLTCTAITPSDISSYNAVITNSGVGSSATLSPFTSTTVSIPTASLTAVRQQFTGDGSTTTFAVAGGYTPNAISVFVNGVLLRNGTEVTVTNGSTVVFAIAPLSGALIDVIGTVPTTYSSITPVSYSVGFNGSSQYLSVPDNTAFDFGSGNFTVDCWVYLNSAVAYAGIITKRSSNANYGPFQLSFGPSGATVTMFVSTSGSSWAINTGATISIGTWYHVAMVRNGTTVTLYLNGLSVATGTATGALMTNSVGLAIGSDQNAAAGNMLNGYISNMRVVKGVAVYTNNFTVPSSPLAITQSASGAYIQAITGTQTSLLTCNGPTIIDGSTNAFTITNNGSAPVSTAIVPTFTNVTINNPVAFYPAGYLIVAGGGAGGGYLDAGGGGAGGLISRSTLLTSGAVYTITVGAGGATSSTSTYLGASGTSSSISGLITGLDAAIGGGGGASYQASGAVAGANGGSGGGGGGFPTSGGLVISGQGSAGATGGLGSGYAYGGGGGGAGATGSSTTGGTGLVSTITGSSVTYAGGGGGGGDYRGGPAGGSGGSGGGGAGTYTNGVAGTVNTGGGGGGAGYSGSSYTGGAGGSGVVILSIPTANYTGRTTGSPTVTTNGIYTVLTFTASGTYTA